ncbi:MAG: hypothetical protein AAB410_02635 [Patescibacteria group bacterium]
MIDAETEIQNIKARNQKVEADKAWEISWTRRIFIFAMTYVVAGVWLELIHDTFPWLKAFVPSLGYILSTLSLRFVKNWWIKNYKKHGPTLL